MIVSELILALQTVPQNAKVGILMDNTLVSITAPTLGTTDKAFYLAPLFKEGEEVVFL